MIPTPPVADQDELAARHQALVERDRWIGLQAEAEAARAHSSRLEERLAVAQQRLDRKNARINQLVRRLHDLEAASPGLSRSRRALGRFRRGLVR